MTSLPTDYFDTLRDFIADQLSFVNHEEMCGSLYVDVSDEITIFMTPEFEGTPGMDFSVEEVDNNACESGLPDWVKSLEAGNIDCSWTGDLETDCKSYRAEFAKVVRKYVDQVRFRHFVYDHSFITE
ncbi:MAG: hypothetical protein CMA63_06680 [Euryarchaeota archaeon]|nr:hypothetical protein [Euryarchaeota archaeon]|tara:strand:- start:2559 stop:2939 length:381 start_codon:yes stop_codon:yes gene_type:complete